MEFALLPSEITFRSPAAWWLSEIGSGRLKSRQKKQARSANKSYHSGRVHICGQLDLEARAELELRHAGARSTSEPGYRAFTRIGDEKVPDAKTLARLGQVIGPEVIGELHERLMELARERGVVQGRKMRVDTTVVETNIHYPTDSGLLRRWSARAHANHEEGKEGYGPRGTRVISSATITRILPNKPNRPTTITREASIIFTTTTYMKC